MLMKPRHWTIPIPLLWACSSPLEGGTVFSIYSGPPTLTIQQNGVTYGVAVQLTNGSAVCQQTNLMAVEAVNSSDIATWNITRVATQLYAADWTCVFPLQR
ncbi:MAG: hypothetical protein ACLQU3_03185 [Limisphaerales bacterium]